jgi:hypothetical protein
VGQIGCLPVLNLHTSTGGWVMSPSEFMRDAYAEMTSLEGKKSLTPEEQSRFYYLRGLCYPSQT